MKWSIELVSIASFGKLFHSLTVQLWKKALLVCNGIETVGSYYITNFTIMVEVWCRVGYYIVLANSMEATVWQGYDGLATILCS